MKRPLLLVAAALMFVSCSSKTKKEDATAAVDAQAAKVALTQDAVVGRYSILELNSAANALKVLADDEKSKDLLGCEITSQKALSMTMPLKALIDDKMRSEVEGYENDPKTYANTEGFESCAKNCACGIFSDIVEQASARKMPPGSSVAHKRNQSKLTAKAQRQTSEASLTCAKKQTWFCGSDLHKFLDKGASEMP